jgi:threonine dehydrogenase-like Zn-dependent dehydrogenase
MLVWPLYGVGLENFGLAGQPVRWPLPRPAPDQILVRSDAVGLCYSDVKIIRQGGSHPRLYQRDLAANPVVQGHEVTMTVVAVGEAWRSRFAPGQRLALQADVYYRGLNLAVGYVFTGGLAQYSLLGPAILDGDEGCYAMDVPAGLGYAEVALTEPWACVEAAYVPRRRLHIKPRGVLWLLGRPGLENAAYEIGQTFAHGLPTKIVATNVPDALCCQVAWPEAEIRNDIAPADYVALMRAEAPDGFDDVIVLDPDPERLDALPDVVAAGATISLVGERPLDRPVRVDAGRIHYDYVTYLGTTGLDVSAAYGRARNRAELRAGGVACIVGGGGPMGRMHLQRMLEMPDGPRKVVVAESNAVRNPELVADFGPLAQARGIELVVLNPKQMTSDAFQEALARAHGGPGFDDIVVIVASVPAIESAMPHLASDGLLVVFGGLARGVQAQLDLSSIYLGGAQITGSAGATIRDQSNVLAKVATGHLSTANAVAAIGGLDAARAGMQALMDGRFPGKMVIYPQVEAFPLTALSELKTVAPAVYARLGEGEVWTRDAEAEFLRRYAAGIYA